jgi:hypothetical protein
MIRTRGGISAGQQRDTETATRIMQLTTWVAAMCMQVIPRPTFRHLFIRAVPTGQVQYEWEQNIYIILPAALSRGLLSL